jgi:hypothetical protein
MVNFFLKIITKKNVFKTQNISHYVTNSHNFIFLFRVIRFLESRYALNLKN